MNTTVKKDLGYAADDDADFNEALRLIVETWNRQPGEQHVE